MSTQSISFISLLFRVAFSVISSSNGMIRRCTLHILVCLMLANEVENVQKNRTKSNRGKKKKQKKHLWREYCLNDENRKRNQRAARNVNERENGYRHHRDTDDFPNMRFLCKIIVCNAKQCRTTSMRNERVKSAECGDGWNRTSNEIMLKWPKNGWRRTDEDEEARAEEAREEKKSPEKLTACAKRIKWQMSWIKWKLDLYATTQWGFAWRASNGMQE